MFSWFYSSDPQPPPKQVRVPTHVTINSNYPIEDPIEDRIEDRIVHVNKSRKHDASLNFYGEKTIKNNKTQKTKNTKNQKNEKPKNLILQIQQNTRIEMNRRLIVAKYSNFAEESSCRGFALSLKNMIMDDTQIGRSIIKNIVVNPNAICRFLKIFVTDADQYFVMPLQSYQLNDSSWVEESFTREVFSEHLSPNLQRVLPELLSMVKRQKQLINTTGSLVIDIEFVLNRRGSKGDKDAFHEDVDVFDNGSDNPEYISVTNTSQQGYGFSTEIKHEDDNKSYTLLAGPCQTIVLWNNGANIVHRSPSLQLINKGRYVHPDVLNDEETYHQSSLSNDDFTSKVVTYLNSDMLLRYEPRNIIRMLISPPDQTLPRDMVDVTHLIPTTIYVSPIINYVMTVFDRGIDEEDIKDGLSYLKDYSIGGKSKKRSKTRSKTRSKKRSKKRVQQRGGGVPEYFAIYAGDERSSQLIGESLLLTD
jgi:hypothetical protein